MGKTVQIGEHPRLKEHEMGTGIILMHKYRVHFISLAFPSFVNKLKIDASEAQTVTYHTVVGQHNKTFGLSYY